jgi:hypothetical protein
VSAQPYDSTSFTVTWTEIQADRRNGIITGYILIWREIITDSVSSNASVPSRPLSCVVRGLKIFTEYEVKIAGFTIIGTGSYSQHVLVKTGEGSRLF